MHDDYPIIDGHVHVIPTVRGRNRFGEVVSDRWGRVLRGGECVPMLPTTCADCTYPVEALAELMDREGVAQAVLLQNPTLGTCNEYIRECTERFPERFCGVIQVDPRDPDAAAQELRGRLLELARKPNIWLGLAAVPILLEEAYPCPHSLELLREAVELLGAHKLIWGSDAPLTLDLHTYRQLVDIVRREVDFLSATEKRQILHDNAKTVFRGLGDE